MRHAVVPDPATGGTGSRFTECPRLLRPVVLSAAGFVAAIGVAFVVRRLYSSLALSLRARRGVAGRVMLTLSWRGRTAPAGWTEAPPALVVPVGADGDDIVYLNLQAAGTVGVAGDWWERVAAALRRSQRPSRLPHQRHHPRPMCRRVIGRLRDGKI